MDLYLYKTGTNIPVLKIENVVSYTDNQAVTEDGAVYSPFADGCELSSLQDCSETLRAQWRREHPAPEDEVKHLRAQIAELEARSSEQDDALIELAGLLIEEVG